MRESMFINHFQRHHDFYRGLRLIAIPIALQQLITTSLNMVDTLMVGKISVDAVAAVGVANQYYFLLSMIMFGLYSGGSVFFAQYYGKRELKKIHGLLGFTLMIGAILSLVFAVTAFMVPEFIIDLFTDSEEAIKLGASYLRVACFSYPFMVLSFGMSTGLRTIEKPKFSMYASILALSLNTVLNFIFIFGLGGVPAMGVVGAALATVISRLVEFCCIYYFAYFKTDEMNPTWRDLIRFNRPQIKQLMITSLPVIINEMFWGLGMTVYVLIYGEISVEAISVMNIVNAIGNIFFIAGNGVGNASTVMLGKQLGANEPLKAIEMARLFTKVCAVFGIISACLYAACIPLIVPLYSSFDDSTLQLMKQVMIISALGTPLRFINMLNIVGIFRSGGDTKYAMTLELGMLWGVGVLGAFTLVKVFSAPLFMVVILIQLEEVLKVIVGYFRVKSNKWVRTLV